MNNEESQKQVASLILENDKLKTYLKKYLTLTKNTDKTTTEIIDKESTLVLENHKLKKQCEDKIKEVNEVIKQNSELKLRLTESKKFNTEKEQRMDILKLQLEEAIQSNNGLQESIQNLEKENNELKVKISQLEEAKDLKQEDKKNSIKTNNTYNIINENALTKQEHLSTKVSFY